MYCQNLIIRTHYETSNMRLARRKRKLCFFLYIAIAILIKDSFQPGCVQYTHISTFSPT